MITDRNQLPPLSAVARPSFENLWQGFKSDYVAELAAIDPVVAVEVAEALEVDGDLFPKMGQMFCQYLIAHMERINEQARQMLPSTARENNLDHVVSLQSLVRQIISPGDPLAFPPVPEVKESDDHLLMRFWLAPHAPAAGSRLHYKFHAMTLDQRPAITVTKPGANIVRVEYALSDGSIAAKIKDANGRRTAAGQVTVTVLSNIGNGIPTADILSGVEAHFARDDVRPETDQVLVQAASVVNYTLTVLCSVKKGPDTSVLQSAMQSALADYAAAQHMLGGKIQRSYITYLMHKAGATDVTVTGPGADVVATDVQAPFCTAINLTVTAI